MKKSTLEALYNVVNGKANITDTLRDEINAEWERTTAKSRANTELYDAAREVVMTTDGWDKPMTVKELWEIVKDNMPEGFTQSKMQYAFREKWAADIQRHDPENARDAYKYSRT